MNHCKYENLYPKLVLHTVYSYAVHLVRIAWTHVRAPLPNYGIAGWQKQSKTGSVSRPDSTTPCIIRINGGGRCEFERERENSQHEYRFPSCRRAVATVNFDHHLPKVLSRVSTADTRWQCVRPGLRPFEISGARCTGGGSPQDLPSSPATSAG